MLRDDRFWNPNLLGAREEDVLDTEVVFEGLVTKEALFGCHAVEAPMARRTAAAVLK